MKKIIKKKFSSLLFFYNILKYRILYSLIFSILVGALDGFGLTMFLPLIQLIDSSGDQTNSLGKLNFLIEGMNAVGLTYKLTTVLLIMWLFFLLKGGVKYLNSLYRVQIQQFFIRFLRINMLSSLNNSSFKYFVTSDPGKIQNTMTGEVDKVLIAFVTYLGTFEQAVMILVYMGFAFFVDAKFATLVILGGLATNLLYKKVYKITKKSSIKLTTDSNSYQGLIIQHIINFKYLKATSRIKIYGQRLIDNIIEIENSRKKMDYLASFLESAREPLLIGVISIVILLQVYVFKGDLSTILLSLMFFYRALMYLTTMQTTWNRFIGVTGSLENMRNFQKELLDNQEIEGGFELNNFNNLIELKNLNFGYNEFSQVIKEVNLTILKNECIAFVGESGSGKTTIVNVISGLLQPTSGTMSIDGKDSLSVNMSKFQNNIGYISQDPVIFNDTIYNNVTFWAEPNEINLNTFNKVIEQALLKDFIQSSANKEQTIIENNGINLSGGQKQRISIARELFKDIDILILDEATSALDSETEKLIQENIDLLKGNYTLIMVAHRLSTIKNCDKIVLMSKGRIVAMNNFENLKSTNTTFKRMVDLQNV